MKRIRSSSKRRIPFLDKRAAVMMTTTVPAMNIARTKKVLATLQTRGRYNLLWIRLGMGVVSMGKTKTGEKE